MEPDDGSGWRAGFSSSGEPHRLSELERATLTSGSGAAIGRIVDVEVAYHHHRPDLLRWIVRRGRRLVAVTGTVTAIDHGAVVLDRASTTDLVGVAPGAPDAGSLLLVQDVLDCQVYDLAGGRLARVSDVHLRLDQGRVTVVAADLGVGSICRRLGLRRVARRLGEDVVLWPDLHLLSRAGHDAQLTTRTAAVHHLGATELADLLVPLPPAQGSEILAAVPADRAARVLAEVGRHDADRWIHAMPGPAADRVIAALPERHATRLRRVRRRGTEPRPRFLRHRPALLRRSSRRSRRTDEHG